MYFYHYEDWDSLYVSLCGVVGFFFYNPDNNAKI